MRIFTLAFLLSISLLLVHETGEAQDRGFGVGATIGSVDGLSYKVWVSESHAVAGAVSFYLEENFSWFYTHADYLFHNPYEELNWEVGDLYYYYGGGARISWMDGVNETWFGLRLPSGLGFDFTDVPIDLFFELAPGIDVSPDFSFGFEGNLGFRFFIN